MEKKADLSHWTKIILGAEFIHYFYYYKAVNACERMGVNKNRMFLFKILCHWLYTLSRETHLKFVFKKVRSYLLFRKISNCCVLETLFF